MVPYVIIRCLATPKLNNCNTNTLVAVKHGMCKLCDYYVEYLATTKQQGLAQFGGHGQNCHGMNQQVITRLVFNPITLRTSKPFQCTSGGGEVGKIFVGQV